MQKLQNLQEQNQEESSLLKEYETIKQSLPETREVILRANSCCGCGCYDVEIKRTVPYDSPLKNGSHVGSNILATDEIL